MGTPSGPMGGRGPWLLYGPDSSGGPTDAGCECCEPSLHCEAGRGGGASGGGPLDGGGIDDAWLAAADGGGGGVGPLLGPLAPYAIFCCRW